jgi:putative peptide zinc metalloprotease protein
VASDPTLQAQVKSGEAKVAELNAMYAAQFLQDRAAAGIAREQLEGERQGLSVLQQRLDRLQVRAPSSGHFVAPRAADLPGRYFHKGEPIGYVIGPSDSGRLVRVVVPQDAVDAVRHATRRVTLRYAHQSDVELDARIVREVPGGDEFLPSRALSVEGGGHLATDPREQTRAKTMERTFQFDVELADPQASAGGFFGERVNVRFVHTAQPLGIQWARAIRLLFLSHFHV